MNTRYHSSESFVYSMWNPFFWLSFIFCTKEGWTAILYVTFVIWFILIVDDMATTLHQINESLIEIRQG